MRVQKAVGQTKLKFPYGNIRERTKNTGKVCVPHYFFENYDDIVGIDD